MNDIVTSGGGQNPEAIEVNPLPPGALPFEPQTDEALRARFDAAVRKCWGAEEMATAAARNASPMFIRAHVFDTVDGYRIGAFIDTLPNVEEPLLHFSISTRQDSVFSRAGITTASQLTPECLRSIIEPIASRIVPEHRTPLPEMDLLFLRVSPRGLLHGFYDATRYIPRTYA